MSLDHSGWALDCKVYIGGLGSGADKEEIEREFKAYGSLKNVWVARNPPGFAFIEYTDPRDAEDAVRALDGILMNGRRIMVQMSTGKIRTKSGLARSRSRSASVSDGYRSRSPPRKHRHRSRSRRSSYETSRSRSRSHSLDSYRCYSRSKDRRKRKPRSRHYHSSYSRSRSRSPSYGSDSSGDYMRQRRRRRSYSCSSQSCCSSISGPSTRASYTRSHSRDRSMSRSQSQERGQSRDQSRDRSMSRSQSQERRKSRSQSRTRSKSRSRSQERSKPRSQSRTRSKSRNQLKKLNCIGRVQNDPGGNRLPPVQDVGHSKKQSPVASQSSSINDNIHVQDTTDQCMCKCASPDKNSGGNVSVISTEIAVQTDPYLLLHFVQKCPEILSETFLRLDRDNVLNNCNFPEVVPSIHQRTARLKSSSSARHLNNELM